MDKLKTRGAEAFQAMFKRESSISKLGYQTVDTSEGERLVAHPEREFSELFAPLTEEVLSSLEDNSIAIIGGVSGSGKSELFLRDNEELNVGGLVQKLNSLERSYFSDSFLSSSLARDSRESVTKNDPDIYIFDESGILSILEQEDERMKVIKYLLEKGKKIVLVGGGELPGKKQSEIIQESLLSSGIEVKDESLFSLEPTILTTSQAKDFLIAKKYSEEHSKKMVERMVKEKIPLTVRVLWNILYYEDQLFSEVDMNSFDLFMEDPNLAEGMHNFIFHLTVKS